MSVSAISNFVAAAAFCVGGDAACEGEHSSNGEYEAHDFLPVSAQESRASRTCQMAPLGRFPAFIAVRLRRHAQRQPNILERRKRRAGAVKHPATPVSFPNMALIPA